MRFRMFVIFFTSEYFANSLCRKFAVGNDFRLSRVRCGVWPLYKLWVILMMGD